MKRSILYLALAGVSLSAFYSCDDLEALCGIGENDLQTGEVFVTSLNHMVDIYKRVDAANKDSVVLNGGVSKIDGAECLIDGDSLIIDFGASEVLCADNKLRKGSIRTKLTGAYNIPSGEVNAVLSNYFVEGTQISGQMDARNDGPISNPSFNIATIAFEVGDESTVDYSVGLLWEEGFETEVSNDDIFNVSGTVSGVDNMNIKNFTSMVIEPLRYVTNCPAVVEKGIMEIELVGDSTVMFMLDFIEADGCNNLFEVTADCDGSPLSFKYPMD